MYIRVDSMLVLAELAMLNRELNKLRSGCGFGIRPAVALRISATVKHAASKVPPKRGLRAPRGRGLDPIKGLS